MRSNDAVSSGTVPTDSSVATRAHNKVPIFGLVVLVPAMRDATQDITPSIETTHLFPASPVRCCMCTLSLDSLV